MFWHSARVLVLPSFIAYSDADRFTARRLPHRPHSSSTGFAGELAASKAHEILRIALVLALADEPPDSGCQMPSLEQVRNADKLTWKLLAKAARKGIRAQ